MKYFTSLFECSCRKLVFPVFRETGTNYFFFLLTVKEYGLLVLIIFKYIFQIYKLKLINSLINIIKFLLRIIIVWEMTRIIAFKLIYNPQDA